MYPIHTRTEKWWIHEYLTWITTTIIIRSICVLSPSLKWTISLEYFVVSGYMEVKNIRSSLIVEVVLALQVGFVRPNPYSKMVSEPNLDLLLGFQRRPHLRLFGAKREEVCRKFRHHCGPLLAVFLRHLACLHSNLQHLHCFECEWVDLVQHCLKSRDMTVLCL